MPKLYDPKCAELAEHFLGDAAKPEFVADMAAFIQGSIEDWFATAKILGGEPEIVGGIKRPDLEASIRSAEGSAPGEIG